MIFLIIYTISSLLFYLIFFCFKEQKWTITENGREWTTTKRIKFPLWFWLIGIIVLIIPIMNIVGEILFMIVLYSKYNNNSDWDYRYRFDNKFIAILNKKY